MITMNKTQLIKVKKLADDIQPTLDDLKANVGNMSNLADEIGMNQKVVVSLIKKMKNPSGNDVKVVAQGQSTLALKEEFKACGFGSGNNADGFYWKLPLNNINANIPDFNYEIKEGKYI